ncbi:MAG: hypothetical protein P4L83_03610 [Nevskia sp.]|nr:hypothetical protein [Nevskia sp.]
MVPRTALAKLVVIDRRGNLLSQIPIKPAAPGQVASGMRFVEALEWLTPNQIAVSGSVNPSTTEYELFDWTTGKTLKAFFDDGGGAAFSPDGQHYAYVTGAPHFARAADRTPTLNLDDKPLYKAAGGQVEFSSRPQWSDDGQSLAVLTADASGRRSVLVAGARSASAAPTPLPAVAGTPQVAPKALFWSGGDLYLTQTTNDGPQAAPRTWILPKGTGAWTSVEATQAPAEPATKSKSAKTLARAAAPGGTYYDVWCGSCDLTALPRRSSVNAE